MLKRKRKYDEYLAQDISSQFHSQFLGTATPSSCGSQNLLTPPSSQIMDTTASQIADDDEDEDMLRPAKRRRHQLHVTGEGSNNETSTTTTTALPPANVQQIYEQIKLQQQEQNTKLYQEQLAKKRKNQVNHFSETKLGTLFVAIFIFSENVDTFVENCKIQKKKQQIQSKEKYFTVDEVKQIVKFRENQLQDEYNRVLQELLQEQYQQFARFNQDYISRQYNSAPCTYTS